MVVEYNDEQREDEGPQPIDPDDQLALPKAEAEPQPIGPDNPFTQHPAIPPPPPPEPFGVVDLPKPNETQPTEDFTPADMVQQKFEAAGIEPDMSLRARSARYEAMGKEGERPGRSADSADWARAEQQLDAFQTQVAERHPEMQQGPQPIQQPAPQPGMAQQPPGPQAFQQPVQPPPGPQPIQQPDMAGEATVLTVLQEILAVLNEMKNDGGAKFT